MSAILEDRAALAADEAPGIFQPATPFGSLRRMCATADDLRISVEASKYGRIELSVSAAGAFTLMTCSVISPATARALAAELIAAANATEAV